VRFPIRTTYYAILFYLKIECCDSGFSCLKRIWRVLKSMPQEFEAILITRPCSSLLPLFGKVRQEKSVISIFLEINLSNNVNTMVSSRAFYWHGYGWLYPQKHPNNSSCFTFMPKTGMRLPKTRVCCDQERESFKITRQKFLQGEVFWKKWKVLIDGRQEIISQSMELSQRRAAHVDG